MNRYALSFSVKPGSEMEAARILSSYSRPRAGAAATGGPPLLRRTSVFMSGQRVVRVMDVAGDIGAVMRHLAAQPQIRAVEEALDPHLAEPRDMRSPEGVRAFLDRSLLLPAHPATPPAHMAGAGEGQAERGQAERGQPGERYGLRYPVRPGRGEEAARLLAGGRPAATGNGGGMPSTVFRRGDLVIEVFEVDATVSDPLERIARGMPAPAALADVMETDAELTTEPGMRHFLGGCVMELLTDRRVGVPA